MGANAHVCVSDLEAPEVDAADRHHLARVLRLRPGEMLTASDGAGGSRQCQWTAEGRMAVAGPIELSARPAPLITVAFAVTKGDRPEWAVQKLTEAGVDAIIPLVAARSVVRWDGDRAGRHIDRLRKVGREAAMQSRRVWLPTIGGPQSFDDLVAGAKAAGHLGHLALAEPGGP